MQSVSGPSRPQANTGRGMFICAAFATPPQLRYFSAPFFRGPASGSFLPHRDCNFFLICTSSIIYSYIVSTTAGAAVRTHVQTRLLLCEALRTPFRLVLSCFFWLTAVLTSHRCVLTSHRCALTSHRCTALVFSGAGTLRLFSRMQYTCINHGVHRYEHPSLLASSQFRTLSTPLRRPVCDIHTYVHAS